MKEFEKLEYSEEIKMEFYTKRMNSPRSNAEIAVTNYDENVVPTNKPFLDLIGWSCTVGINFATFNNFASLNFHLKVGDKDMILMIFIWGEMAANNLVLLTAGKICSKALRIANKLLDKISRSVDALRDTNISAIRQLAAAT